MKELVLVLLLPALACGLSTPAHADEPLAPEENGLKVGAGRLHPYLELEGRYDSNPLVNEQGAAVEDFVLHFRPGFTMNVPSPAVALDLAGNADYNLYLGAFSPATTGLDRLLANGNANLTFNSDGAVLARLGGVVNRTDETPNLLLGRSAIADLVEGHFGLGIQPGGKALIFEPAYVLNYSHYENQDVVLDPVCNPGEPSCDTSVVSLFNQITHTGQLGIRWRFFPKTALVLDSSFGAAHFFQAGDFDSLNLKLQAGLQGLLTSRFSVIAKAGWGFQPGSGAFSSMIGQLELAYLASELSQLRLGYVRTFDPAPVEGAFFRDDRLYLDGRTIVSGRLLLHAGANLDFAHYGDGSSFRLFRIDGGPDVRITDWFSTGVGAAYTQRVGTGTSSLFAFDYHRVEAYLRLKFIY